ncbi:hypothetical protein KKD03_03940 [Patescibacteria group bacterium]|nr:hypothetical protein [Patescibacteria group bacterium]
MWSFLAIVSTSGSSGIVTIYRIPSFRMHLLFKQKPSGSILAGPLLNSQFAVLGHLSPASTNKVI